MEGDILLMEREVFTGDYLHHGVPVANCPHERRLAELKAQATGLGLQYVERRLHEAHTEMRFMQLPADPAEQALLASYFRPFGKSSVHVDPLGDIYLRVDVPRPGAAASQLAVLVGGTLLAVGAVLLFWH